MVVTYSISIGGTTVSDDIKNCIVRVSSSENETGSTFEMHLNNFNGRYTSSFTINDEISITLNSVVVFVGIVEDVVVEGNELNNTLVLSGRDYSARLVDVTIEPEIYVNTEVSAIIADFISKYVVNVTYDQVVIGTVITKITFNHVPVYDALRRLANDCGCYFYVDTSKVLHFLTKTSGTSSGVTFDNTNIINDDFDTARKEVYNKVWFYGGRTLSGWKNTFIQDGVGSIFTLDYKPTSTTVSVDGTTKKGGVFEFNTEPYSGTQYLVDYDTMRIIFTSGTAVGNNIPASGEAGSIIATYDRSLAIVKYAQDDDSINFYGPREKVIVDKNVIDPNEAMNRVVSTLENYSDPTVEGNVEVKGFFSLNVGQTVVVNIAEDGIVDKTYNVVEISYDISQENCLYETIMRVRLNKKLTDITDSIKALALQIREIQGDSFNTTDVLTRGKFVTGSVGVKERYVKVSTTLICDNFVLEHPTNGVMDSDYLLALSQDSGLEIQRVMWHNNTVDEPFTDTLFKSGNTTADGWGTGSLVFSVGDVAYSPVIACHGDIIKSGLATYTLGSVYQTVGSPTYYFPLNVSGTRALDVIAGKIGSMLGSVMFTSGGILGSCVYNYGTDGRVTVFQGQMYIAGDRGVCAWVKANQIRTQGVFTNAFNYMRLFMTSDGKYEYDDGASEIGNIQSSVTVTGTWYHLVADYNAAGSQMHLYMNGSLQGTASNVKLPNLSGNFNMFGNETNRLDGYISDCRIYNRVLTQQEVDAIYNSGAGTLVTNPSYNVAGSDVSLLLSDDGIQYHVAGNNSPVSLNGGSKLFWGCLALGSSVLTGVNVNYYI